MNCTRCGGLLVAGYDEHERVEFAKCINCGARPMQKPVKLDTRDLDAPLMCVVCGVTPRPKKSAKGPQIKRCAECQKAWRKSYRAARHKREKAAKRTRKKVAI